MDYVISIPSYNRPDELVKKTLSTLLKYNIDKSKINIFVADEEQKEIYSAIVPTNLYNEIIVGIKGIANVWNFITEYYPLDTKIISIDDDIEKVLILKDNKLVELEDLDLLFNKGFTLLEDYKYNIWGIYPVKNAYFMKEDYSTDLKFIIGHLFGYINRRIKVHNDYRGDYERTLENAIRDGGVIRFNNIVAYTKIAAKGGVNKSMKDRANSKESKDFVLFLKDKYNGLVRDNKCRENEILLNRNIKLYIKK